MIINGRIKGLVEMDTVLRRAERDAAKYDDPVSHARLAVQRVRAGENPHGVLRPYVTAYERADNEHRREIDAGLMGHGSGDRAKQLASTRDHLLDRLHAVGRAIGHEPGHLMARRTNPGALIPEDPHAHVSRLGRAYRGNTTAESYGPGNRAVYGRSFDSHESARGFASSIRHHYPHLSVRHSPPSEPNGHHTVTWSYWQTR